MAPFALMILLFRERDGSFITKRLLYDVDRFLDTGIPIFFCVLEVRASFFAVLVTMGLAAMTTGITKRDCSKDSGLFITFYISEII